MAVRNYIQNRNGTYYFRRAVPPSLRHLILTDSGKPRTEWVWSLKVKQYDEAKRRLPGCLAITNERIDQARRGIATSVDLPATNPSRNDTAISQEVWDRMQQNSIEGAEVLYQQVFEDETRAEADPTFAEALKLRAAQARDRQRLEDAEYAREYVKGERAKRKVSLTELFERYASTPGRHPKTIAQWRPYIAHLANFLGSDNALDVTHDMLVAWRNQLRDKVTYRGRPLDAKTINGSYLGAVAALFAWAKGDGIIARNPMLEVTKIKVRRKATVRDNAFTRDEAKLILGASLLKATSREGEDLRNAKRWCPWLMAYSGARVNEITQLRKEDVFEQDGVIVMRLTPDAGTIKTNTFRLVPLHSHLIKQGFTNFVANRPDGPLFYNPTKRRSDNAINRQPNRLGSKLAEWVRSLGIKDVKPNHAWRNLFASMAVRYDLDPRTTKAIMGHAATEEHDKYITNYADVMAKQIEKIPAFLDH